MKWIIDISAEDLYYAKNYAASSVLSLANISSIIKSVQNGNSQQKSFTLSNTTSKKCKWIKYDHRTMCPKEHIDVDNPYWRIPENRMETLKYCPYCGKEIEVEE